MKYLDSLVTKLQNHSRKNSNLASNQVTKQERAFITHLSGSECPKFKVDQLDSRREVLGQNPKFRLGINDFEKLRTLGTGTFARVWLVRLSNPSKEDRDKVFALKVLRKVEVIRLGQVNHVKNERRILADLAGHSFITNLITSFSDQDSLYLLLDYCPGGEVFSYLRKSRRFDEDVARFYATEIVIILEYLHECKGIAYRDLKPENLLLDADGHIKLVDFGFGKILGNQETYTLCGTPEYLAPEVIQSQGHTTAVDWWALGILIYEFLTGYPPFWHQTNALETYKQIISKPITFPTDILISPEAKDIIYQFCTTNRFYRLGNISGGAKRVKNHPFFRGVIWEDVYSRKHRGPIIPPLRYPSDAQCYDYYPDETKESEPYSSELRLIWEDQFKDF